VKNRKYGCGAGKLIKRLLKSLDQMQRGEVPVCW